jgi:membrane protein
MFFKDYEYIINKIYGVKSRAIYKLFFMYLGFLILIPVLFFIFIFISTIAIFSFFAKITTFIFIWFLFVILFILSANIKVSFNAAALASLVTLLSLSVTKSLFGYYVIANTTFATIYGSFSVALFFFLWIYVSWNIYLYGTKLCAYINLKSQKTNDD